MSDYEIDIIVVGGGGGGAKGGGGGGGEVISTHREIGEYSLNISLGEGGCGGTEIGGIGGYTCVMDSCGSPFIIASGGYGACRCASGTGPYPDYNIGVPSYGVNATCGGSGGNGANWDYSCGGGVKYRSGCGGNGGGGICGYGGGGGGGAPRNYKAKFGLGVDGGGNGGCCDGCPGTNGGGGGGSGCQNTRVGGQGGNGLVVICYKTDGSCGINSATGGNVTTEGDYTIHTFTSDGTFTIVS